MPKRKTSSDLSLLGRLGAYSQHAQHDTKKTTEKARATWNEHFVDQVDPNRILDEAERDRRAKAARQAHYTRMALRSAQARRTRKTSRNNPNDEGIQS